VGILAMQKNMRGSKYFAIDGLDRLFFRPVATGRNRPKSAFESNAQLPAKSGHSICFSGTIKPGKNELCV